MNHRQDLWCIQFADSFEYSFRMLAWYTEGATNRGLHNIDICGYFKLQHQYPTSKCFIHPYYSASGSFFCSLQFSIKYLSVNWCEDVTITGVGNKINVKHKTAFVKSNPRGDKVKDVSSKKKKSSKAENAFGESGVWNVHFKRTINVL